MRNKYLYVMFLMICTTANANQSVFKAEDFAYLAGNELCLRKVYPGISASEFQKKLQAKAREKGITDFGMDKYVRSKKQYGTDQNYQKQYTMKSVVYLNQCMSIEHNTKPLEKEFAGLPTYQGGTVVRRMSNLLRLVSKDPYKKVLQFYMNEIKKYDYEEYVVKGSGCYTNN